MVAKALDQWLRPNFWQPAIVFNDSAYNNTQDIAQRKSRSEEIGFFNRDCKKPGLVIIINCYIYYQDIYVLIDWLKDIALLWSIKKTRAVLL